MRERDAGPKRNYYPIIESEIDLTGGTAFRGHTWQFSAKLTQVCFIICTFENIEIDIIIIINFKLQSIFVDDNNVLRNSAKSSHFLPNMMS